MSQNRNQNNQNNCTRDVGPTLRICQINVEGISCAKSDYLSRLCADENIDVALIQETHTATMEDLNKRGKVEGFEMIVAENSNVHGIATYVKRNVVDVDVIESSIKDLIHTSTIQAGFLKITNVYKPPNTQWDDSVMKTFSHPAIYAGDFNSHHTEWGYGSNDSNGESLVEWASNNELHLVHEPKDRGTFHSRVHRRDYNPDLCFVSADSEGFPLHVTRKVLSSFPNSQHRPVILEVGIRIPLIASVPRPRWNFRKADWNSLKEQLDAAIRFIPPLVKNYERFTRLVINTAKKCIPRGYRKEYIPCWNEDSDRLFEEFRESEDPEIAKELLKSLDEARRMRWIETVESIDMTHSSRKGGSVIRKLGGASRVNCKKPKINANKIASRII